MYERMDYDYIMSEMMAEAPDGIDTSEGSLFFNACAKQAVRLEEAYAALDQIANDMFPDTADLPALIRIGNDRGVYIQYATFAEFTAQFNVAVPEGGRFNSGDYNYTVLDAVDEEEHTYTVVCDTPGKAPNTYLPDLVPIDYVEGFESGKILECTKEGTDMEDTATYRGRVLASMLNQGSGGNREYYISRMKQQPGVGGVKLTRVKTPQDIINLTLITSDWDAPDEDFLEQMQTYVDPVVNSGEGYGIAPIGHRVTVLPVEETTVNISTDITYEEGVEYADVQAQIEAAIEAYLLSLRQTWEEENSLVVRIVQIEAALVQISGILDVAGTKINDVESNLILSGTIPVLGVITCT